MNNRSFLSNLPPVVKNLLAINVIMFLAAWVLPGVFARMGQEVNLNDILGMHYWQSTHFNPAQFITYAFMHGGFFHIFFNMLTLFMFGPILEHVWGAKKFLFYYLVAAVGAALVQQVIWTIEFYPQLAEITRQIDSNVANAAELLQMKNGFLSNPDMITIGASGSVFGLLLAFGWLFPEQVLYIYFIPMKAKYGVFVFGFMELFFGVANFSGDNIAHFAHLGGMLFGALLLLYWKKQNRLYK